ncbi:unnamed protein product [Prorocentrum cordatum]|uniref:Uncharacterized protein n=1 Tax=Prorocentrum cordatum TaxID=2364126 RepID=A0ABN9SY95_9DINO|nr:unnamed protein product [Polarella glacialis]
MCAQLLCQVSGVTSASQSLCPLLLPPSNKERKPPIQRRVTAIQRRSVSILASSRTSQQDGTKGSRALPHKDRDHSERCPQAPSSDASGEELAVALRHYRSEVRRVCGALRDPDVARGLLERLRDGSLSAASIAALPAEQLLPEAKRARLRELRAMPPEESGRERKDLPFEDPTMVCAECGKQGRVRFGYLVSVREGYGKAETWGSKDNEERGERCKAQCGDCLAEWTYDV